MKIKIKSFNLKKKVGKSEIKFYDALSKIEKKWVRKNTEIFRKRFKRFQNKCKTL